MRKILMRKIYEENFNGESFNEGNFKILMRKIASFFISIIIE